MSLLNTSLLYSYVEGHAIFYYKAITEKTSLVMINNYDYNGSHALIHNTCVNL